MKKLSETLTELKELVKFTRDSAGILQFCDVKGGVRGDVKAMQTN
jgi:hypothetical protein